MSKLMNWRNGKITKYPGLWTLRPGRKEIHVTDTDQRGRTMYLVRGPGVGCDDLERWAEEWPVIDNGKVSVSWAACKGCKRHKHGFCAVLAERRKEELVDMRHWVAALAGF